MNSKPWNTVLIAGVGAIIGAGYATFDAVSGYGATLTTGEAIGAAAGGAASGALLGALVAIIRNRFAR